MVTRRILKEQVLSEGQLGLPVGEPRTPMMTKLERMYRQPIRNILKGSILSIERRYGIKRATVYKWRRMLNMGH
jgi:hypothetical protein